MLIENAKELLDESHPLHSTFVKWVKKNNEDTEPTKRQANRFLAKFPQYRAKKKVVSNHNPMRKKELVH